MTKDPSSLTLPVMTGMGRNSPASKISRGSLGITGSIPSMPRCTTGDRPLKPSPPARRSSICTCEAEHDLTWGLTVGQGSDIHPGGTGATRTLAKHRHQVRVSGKVMDVFLDLQELYKK
ncbi:hypothetical protein E2C01_026558 [Portunus trituberculatus]|uniref:Uncharacterized protein n=1 Tax=Portunus trituberculatus TaxID=210409 RepID=A0A5B7EIH3_PORTR|nr:hypothetical protein [Portunus trituberculatus]